jgi:hypothetical protein
MLAAVVAAGFSARFPPVKLNAASVPVLGLSAGLAGKLKAGAGMELPAAGMELPAVLAWGPPPNVNNDVAVVVGAV